MIFVCKTSSRPPQDGSFDLLHRLDNICPDPAHIGYIRILTDPEPAVDAMAQVLGEVTVNIPADFVLGLADVEGCDIGRVLGKCERGEEKSKDERRANFSCVHDL